MKLSEMNVNELSDCLLILADPVANILEDPGLGGYLREFASEKKEQNRAAMLGKAAKKLLPILLRDHRKDLILIISALTGLTVDVIENQNGLATIRQAVELIDKELLDFFR